MWLLARRHKGSEGFPPVLLLNAQNVSWVNNTRAICIFSFFFPYFGNKRRTEVATSEWKNTGLELCNEKTASSERGRGTTTHIFHWYMNSAVLEAFQHYVSDLSHCIQKRNIECDSAACSLERLQQIRFWQMEDLLKSLSTACWFSSPEKKK